MIKKTPSPEAVKYSKKITKEATVTRTELWKTLWLILGWKNFHVNLKCLHYINQKATESLSLSQLVGILVWK